MGNGINNGYDLRTLGDEEIRTLSSTFSVQLNVKDNPVTTFKFLKGLQDLGYANKDSMIVVNRVRVPAGYCSDYIHFLTIYNAIQTGDRATVYDLVPDDLDVSDVVHFIGICSSSMKSIGFESFTNDEVRNFLQYRQASQQNRGQK